MLGASRRTLLRVLGLTFGLAVIIGNTIAAGIFRTPGEIAGHLPTFAVHLGLDHRRDLRSSGANALAELGTLVPKSGGQYVFVRHALGDYAGFVVGWSDWVSTCGTMAAVSIVIGEYAIHLLPYLRAVEVIAIVVIGILTLVSWLGGGGAWISQDVTSLIKCIALVFLIGACFLLGNRNPMASSLEVEREGSLMLAFILALQAVIYTYDGWSAVIYFSEEVKDPAKNIPRAMFGGVISVAAVYLLLNLAFLRVVSLPTIAGEAGGRRRRAESFRPPGDPILRSLTIALLISAVNSNVLMAPRVLFAMSRDGLFWRGATEVNKGERRMWRCCSAALMATLFIVSGKFDQVIATLAFFFVANYTLSFTALFVLRKREPDAPRPASRDRTSLHHRSGAAGLGGLSDRCGGVGYPEQRVRAGGSGA